MGVDVTAFGEVTAPQSAGLARPAGAPMRRAHKRWRAAIGESASHGVKLGGNRPAGFGEQVVANSLLGPARKGFMLERNPEGGRDRHTVRAPLPPLVVPLEPQRRCTLPPRVSRPRRDPVADNALLLQRPFRDGARLEPVI